MDIEKLVSVHDEVQELFSEADSEWVQTHDQTFLQARVSLGHALGHLAKAIEEVFQT